MSKSKEISQESSLSSLHQRLVFSDAQLASFILKDMTSRYGKPYKIVKGFQVETQKKDIAGLTTWVGVTNIVNPDCEHFNISVYQVVDEEIIGRAFAVLKREWVNKHWFSYSEIHDNTPWVGYTTTRKFPRKGLAIERLIVLNTILESEFGAQLRSSMDSMISDEARMVWEKLCKEGLATQKQFLRPHHEPVLYWQFRGDENGS